jgi:hypothetical protein
LNYWSAHGHAVFVARPFVHHLFSDRSNTLIHPVMATTSQNIRLCSLARSVSTYVRGTPWKIQDFLGF